QNQLLPPCPSSSSAAGGRARQRAGSQWHLAPQKLSPIRSQQHFREPGGRSQSHPTRHHRWRRTERRGEGASSSEELSEAETSLSRKTSSSSSLQPSKISTSS